MITLFILPQLDNLKDLCHLCGDKNNGKKVTNWVSIPIKNIVFYQTFIKFII